jgi:hypothetical protein
MSIKKAITSQTPSASVTRAEVRKKMLAEEKKEIERRKETDANARTFSDKIGLTDWRMKWEGEHDDGSQERQSMEAGKWKSCVMNNQFDGCDARCEFCFDKLTGPRK